MSKKRNILFISGAFLFLLSFWELGSRFNSHLLLVLPPPSLILKTVFQNYERLIFHSAITFREMSLGFLIALFSSFPLAWVMFRFKTSRALLQPLFIIIQCMPMFALAPLMIIWFGWNFIAIVIPTALMIFFPLTLNIYQGLKATPQEYLDFFKTQQATQAQTFFKLRLPWAMPHIFAGFRISAAISGFGAIAGEWAGAQEGLGILMLESRRNADIEMTFASLLMLTLMTSSFYSFVVIIEKLKFSFKKRTQKLFPKKEIVLSLFMISFFLSSCEKKESGTTQILLDWLPNPNHVPLFVGIQKGFFQEEGIDLAIKKMSDQHGCVSLLTSHQTDLIVYHLPGTIRALAKGAELTIIGALIKEPLISFIYKKDKIQNKEELSGKTLGYCVGGTTAFLDYILEKDNIQLKNKINVGGDYLAAMATEKIDFIYGGHWNIESFQLESMGIETGYLKISEFDIPNFYELIIVAHQNSFHSSPNFIASFQKSLQKSIDFCTSHPEEAFQIYLSLNHDKREKTKSWEKKAWNATYPILAKDQNIDTKTVNDFSLFLKQHL